MNLNLIIQTKHTMYSFQIALIYALQNDQTAMWLVSSTETQMLMGRKTDT